MIDRLKAWIGFNDGDCDEDTQMLIDDIKSLEKENAELKEAVEYIANLEAVDKDEAAAVWFCKAAIKARQTLAKYSEKGE